MHLCSANFMIKVKIKRNIEKQKIKRKRFKIQKLGSYK